ncbi:hypothetical protein FJZ31_04810 [Candidatus Poribacteria bacterium]|nr:hypothetical protein [Candidatus Poribacteria bacterium]
MDARLLIAILIGIIWLALRLLRRKPEDTQQQEQRGGDVIFTEAEVNLPWEQIPQGRRMLEEYNDEEEIEPVGEELNINREDGFTSVNHVEKKEPPVLQSTLSPATSTKPKRETNQDITQMTSVTPAQSQKRPKQIRQIAGMPLNTPNVKFGIILSEILNKPKSQRI